ncbi:MAG: nucleoside phosphorylase [candidate division NC10 bacterium]|nr:nucleoside phosphorylase [candidate division NC10 bacterium]
MATPPILLNKHYTEPSVFTAENLLREARRQKSLPRGQVPRICVLDPDGDIVRWLVATRRAERSLQWACYHTDLYSFAQDDMRFGIVGCAVGASFAVLVAEELFSSGCELLISVTSAGQIAEPKEPPYFVLIEKALRDEGTSYHYLPPGDFSRIAPGLLRTVEGVFTQTAMPLFRGATWTTDAPFRETASAVARCRDLGIMAVEMEAAALYAFADATQKSVVCLAHVTNRMARTEGDFEKGIAGGSQDALQMVGLVARVWMNCQPG